MAAHKRQVLLVALFTISWHAVVAAEERNLTTYPNYMCDIPECEEMEKTESFPNLVYVKATGRADILHYAFSTIQGVPSVLIIRTNYDPSIELKVDWKKLLSYPSKEFFNKSITVDGNNVKILYQYAVVFTRLHEYNDTDDAADLTHYPFRNSTERVIWSFSNFTWENVSHVEGNKNSVVFNSTMMNQHLLDHSPPKNYTPSVSFVFRIHGNESREDMLPHLLYNENVTQFDFTINNFPAAFVNSRFAIELAIFSTADKDKMELNESQSIDDEFTPGVFRVITVRTKPSDQVHGAYLEYKPVCYTDEPRTHSVATKAFHYALGDIKNFTNIINASMVHAYFGDGLYNGKVKSVSTNISFGLTKDRFYMHSNYTSWSASVGYGIPPEDKISILVIGVISAGLGIPVIIMMFGGVYMFCKKRNEKSFRRLEDVSSSYPQAN